MRDTLSISHWIATLDWHCRKLMWRIRAGERTGDVPAVQDAQSRLLGAALLRRTLGAHLARKGKTRG